MKNNGLIAIFMGAELTHCTIKGCKPCENCDFDYCGYSKEPLYRFGEHRWDCWEEDKLLYHLKWDALKPVIDKIAKMAESNRKYMLSKSYQRIRDIGIIWPIDMAYEAVVEFIEWYNTLKD